MGVGLYGAEIFECLLLLLHTIRRCTCWCTNSEGVLAVRKANSSPFHEAIKRISLQLMECLGCMADILKLDWTLDTCNRGEMRPPYLNETHRPVILLTETQFAETRVSTEQLT